MHEQHNFSQVSQSSFIKGELSFNSDTIIYGKVEGIISISGEYKLTLEENSSVSGQIFCHKLEVLGEVKGSIQSRSTVTVRAGAQVNGDIKSDALVVYPGAILNLEAHCEKSL